MFNKHKADQDLRVQGQIHLKSWVEYITKPSQDEIMDWHRYESYRNVDLKEDYVDFTYLSRKYRLEMGIDAERGVGILKMSERTYTKADHELNPIWEFNYIGELDMSFGINTTITFIIPRYTEKKGETAQIPGMPSLRKGYAVEFDKCTEQRSAERRGKS